MISFHFDESNYHNNLHDDILVISLSIANFPTKQILEDNKSSTNVLYLNAYKEIRLKESDITKRKFPLIALAVNPETRSGRLYF